MKLRRVLCSGIFLMVLGACASNGHQNNTSVHMGVGYHDPWYHGGYYYGNYPPAVMVPPPYPARPPGNRPPVDGRPPIDARPPVAKPPIAKPPVSRPPSIPSRPRPTPMRGGRR